MGHLHWFHLRKASDAILKKNRPIPNVLVPDGGLGWTGGDNYIKSLKKALLVLQKEGALKLLSESDSSSLLSFLFRNQVTINGLESNEKRIEAIHLPWPLIPGIKNPIQWIPDLQDIEEPNFFSLEERSARKSQIIDAIEINTAFYFSSKHTEGIFKEEYPRGKTIGVVRFAADSKKRKHKSTINCNLCLDSGFYYVPNNWWKHKNHSLLIDAFMKYKKLGGRKHLILTGQEDDYRWPSYQGTIHTKLETASNIHNFGFCSLETRNALYSNSFCVVQPSLYEGWSTSVEESLTYKKRLIVSDITVFKEQLEGVENYLKFDRTNVESLVSAFFELEKEPSKPIVVNPKERELRFHDDLRSLIISAFSHKLGGSF